MRTGLLGVVLVLFPTGFAHAFGLTGFGGSYLWKGEQGLYGGELTLAPNSIWTFGLFYEFSRGATGEQIPDEADTRHFYGVVGRYKFEGRALFVDGRMGMHYTTEASGGALSGPYFQPGVGYAYELVPGMVDLSPRLGMILLALSHRYPVFNASVLATIYF
jgi:hypothetical protein